MDCRISLAQTNPVLGDLRTNLEDHLAKARAAAESGSDVVLFPELSLTGYFLKDMTYELGLPLDAPELDELRRASEAISLGVGFVERSPEGRLYNAWAFLEDGELLAVHRKVHLVTYGMFEESRDLASGERYGAIASRHGRFGALICEDMWHLAGPYVHFLADVEAILVPSASPARGVAQPGPGLASARTWSTMLEAVALFTRTWVLYVNRVGLEDGITFAGGSRVVDPFGQPVLSLPALDPHLGQHRIGSSALARARVQTPLRRDEKPWILARELERLASEAAP